MLRPFLIPAQFKLRTPDTISPCSESAMLDSHRNAHGFSSWCVHYPASNVIARTPVGKPILT
eukprot:12376015-Alexandrium_andersonii.AAC.1